MESTFMRCALKVDTQTPGWQASMDDLLSTVEDVSYNIDSLQGFAYVSGNINPGRFMRRLARAKQMELCWADSRQINKNNPTVQEPGYYDEYGQYRRLDYDYANGNPIVQGGGYYDEYGQYRRYNNYANGYNLSHRYGAPGYGYGNNQYGRLPYWDENCPMGAAAAQSSLHALPPVPDKNPPLPPPSPVPEALRKGEDKWINCCMM